MHLEEGRRQLIGHDVEDVWLLCWSRARRVLIHAGHALCCVFSWGKRDRVQIRSHVGRANVSATATARVSSWTSFVLVSCFNANADAVLLSEYVGMYLLVLVLVLVFVVLVLVCGR